MNKKTLLLLVLSSLLVSFAAQAKPDGAPRDEKGKRPTPEEMFERIDSNKDGSLSKEEFLAAHKKRGENVKEQANKVKDADTNDNGSISKNEAEAAGLKRLVENFDKIDGNDDGEITPKEMKAMRERTGPQDGKGQKKGQ